MKAHHHHQGSVRVPSLEKPVLLVGRESMNRSVDGDVVVVEIFPKSQWKAPAGEVLDQEGEFLPLWWAFLMFLVALKDDDAEDDEGAGVVEKDKLAGAAETMDVDAETKATTRAIQPTGRVVGVVKRNWRA